MALFLILIGTSKLRNRDQLFCEIGTIGVLYFWKGGDTRILEIKFAGPTGTSVPVTSGTQGT